MNVKITFNEKKREFEMNPIEISKHPNTTKESIQNFIKKLNEIDHSKFFNFYNIWLILFFAISVGSFLMAIISPYLVFLPLASLCVLLAVFFIQRFYFKMFKKHIEIVCDEWESIFEKEFQIERKLSNVRFYSMDSIVIILSKIIKIRTQMSEF